MVFGLRDSQQQCQWAGLSVSQKADMLVQTCSCTSEPSRRCIQDTCYAEIGAPTQCVQSLTQRRKPTDLKGGLTAMLLQVST